MLMILIVLVTCYSGLTILAAFATWRDAPVLNLTALAAAVILFVGLYWYYLISIGLVTLIVLAIANGVQRYQRVHYRHLVVRILLSIVILALATGLRH
jgi:hypothetical protein